MRKTFITLGAAALLGVCTAAKAGTLYFNGFEPTQPGTTDIYDSSTGNPGVNVTVVPSGGGTLHLTAPGGANYAEITNTDSAYQPIGTDGIGYGESIFTDYGYSRNGGTFDINGNPTAAGIASNSFYESTDYYINTTWAAASADNNYTGFWIDSTPFNDQSYLDETNFRIIDTGNGQIGVNFVGLNGNSGATNQNATITASGWYTFKTTFQSDGNGNVLNVMSVINSLGATIGSYTVDSSLPFADLGGTNYGDWTTVWQNGFAGDVLGIDNITVGSIAAVPLPKTAFGGALLLAALAAWRMRQRRTLATAAY